MPRGGKRERAGRKTTWDSGVKFEETSLIRVPNYIKNQLLEIAHKLDAGQNIDLTSDSNQQELEELKFKLSTIEFENQKLKDELEKSHLDLETESKILNLRLDELIRANESLIREFENAKLDLVTKSKELKDIIFNLEAENKLLKSKLPQFSKLSDTSSTNFLEFIAQYLQEWKIQISGLSPINTAAKTHQMLPELQKIVLEHKESLDLLKIAEPDVNIPSTNHPTNKNDSNEIVTESKGHTQLGLLGIDNHDNSTSLKPLKNVYLAKRLGIDPSNLVAIRKKGNEKLISYTASKDPQKIGWRYSESEKLYYPVI